VGVPGTKNINSQANLSMKFRMGVFVFAQRYHIARFVDKHDRTGNICNPIFVNGAIARGSKHPHNYTTLSQHCDNLRICGEA
jgi:hypothetical protein